MNNSELVARTYHIYLTLSKDNGFDTSVTLDDDLIPSQSSNKKLLRERLRRFKGRHYYSDNPSQETYDENRAYWHILRDPRRDPYRETVHKNNAKRL